jgi:hypothetical protein
MSFDVRRLRSEDYLLAVSGIALIVLLFATSWYSRAGLTGRSGWDTVSHLRWLLLLAGVMAGASALVTASQRSPALPVASEVAILIVGAVAFLWLAVRILIDQPGGGSLGDVTVAGYLSLVACAGVAVGGWLAVRDESPGRIPAPTDGEAGGIPVRPAPPAGGEDRQAGPA